MDDPDHDAVRDVRLLDYLELVDQTGRALRQDKRGAVPENALLVLTRLGIGTETWLYHMRPRLNHLLKAMRSPARLRAGGRRAVAVELACLLRALSGPVIHDRPGARLSVSPELRR